MIFGVRRFRPALGSPWTGPSPWSSQPGLGGGEPFRRGEAALWESASKTDMGWPSQGGQSARPPQASPQAMAGKGSGGAGQAKDRIHSGLSPAPGEKMESEDAPEPQPSCEDGVPEDMATLVLDKAALGQGPIARPDPETERMAVERHFAAADPASDAAIM